MKLIYFQGKVLNFGDDLNAILWPTLAPDLFKLEDGQGFLGIGTIIGMKFAPLQKLHVFSSGVGYNSTEFGADIRQIWCVRGPLSAKFLGLDEDRALSDGGILMPLIIAPSKTQTYDISVIPHFETLSSGNWQEACDMANMHLISPMQDVKTVISEITRSKLVLTESLHGAIIADAYGIPWIAFSTNGNFSTFKWSDWTKGLDLELKIGHVPPPSGKSILHYGRPPTGKWGAYQNISEDVIASEMKQRLFVHGDDHAPSTLNRLKNAVKAGLLKSKLGSSAFGMTTQSCARHLTQLARQKPQLSATAKRQDLTQEMLTRLTSLCATQDYSPAFPELKASL